VIRRWWWLIVVGALTLWFGVSVFALQRLRAREHGRFEEPVPSSHASLIEPVELRTDDGERLGAWFIDATRGDAPSVIELHGKGGTRRARLGAADIVRERGCAVFFVTLRAHGDSSGETEDFGWSARHDVIAAVEWVQARRPGRKVLLHGASLGAAAAVFAAEELGTAVDAYALECLYLDLDSAARTRCELALPPVLDRVAWLGLRAAASLTWPEFRSISPREALARVPPGASITLIAGGADEHARMEDTQTLFELVATRAHLAVIEGAPHDRLLAHDARRYREVVLEWLARNGG
jgi:alpha-beta hydrolase superfamily lysophospholipase